MINCHNLTPDIRNSGAPRTPRLRNSVLLGMAIASTLMALTGVANAQPERQPDRPAHDQPPPDEHRGNPDDDAMRGPGQGGEQSPQDRGRAKELMQRRMEQLRQQQRDLDEAMAMLEKGEPMSAVLRKARSAMGGGGERARERFNDNREDRPGFLGGPGRPRGPGGPDGGPDGRPNGPGGRGGPDGPGGPGRPGMPELGPGEMPPGPMLAQMMKFLHEHRPELADKIERMRAEHPEEFRNFIKERAPEVLKLMKEQMDDPEMWKLRRKLMEVERETRDAARFARQAPPEKRDEAIKHLRDAVGHQFEVRADLTRQELKATKSRAERLEKQLDERLTNRDKFLDERVQELLKSDGPPPPPDGGPRGGPDDRGGPDGKPDQRRGGKPSKGRDLFEDDRPAPKQPPADGGEKRPN